MNVLASECSSGCESGWTVYFEQSFLSPNDSHHNKGNEFVNGKSVLRTTHEDEEEEDLSMVSDASSGPPHFQEEAEQVYVNVDDDSCFCSKASKDVRLISKSVGKRKKSREQRRCGGQEQVQVPTNFLDDTASSPVYNFSMQTDYDINNNNNNQASMESVLEFSEGVSATHHFKGRSAFQDPYDFFQSSLSGNQLQKNQLSTKSPLLFNS
ncbi:hypothetical protein FNV43_RR22660 [Rhamnella rubrinervis]|uniref:Uncharacterized protein n=1 Tax=Rhamnella rubrinervis TaxID=2594499 RepID=A0A8K0DVM7_9ROSA|nr:hypothetical protein FNV43_RR22660 [Rhamnella rubrinervis]